MMIILKLKKTKTSVDERFVAIYKLIFRSYFFNQHYWLFYTCLLKTSSHR